MRPILLMALLWLGLCVHCGCIDNDSGSSSTADHVNADQDAPSESTRQLTACQNVATIFRSLNMPQAQGKHWVQISDDRQIAGWLIDVSPESLSILDENGSLQRINREDSNHQQANKNTLQNGFSEQQDVSDYKIADFAEFCQAFIAEGPPDIDRVDRQIRYLDGGGQGRIGNHIVATCRYAYWALEQDDEKLACQLYAVAENTLSFWNKRFIQRESNLVNFVAERLASGRKTNAILEANQCRPRIDLLEEWKVIARIPDHNLVEEADKMAGYYKSLIAEDRRWIEPPENRLGKMTPSEKAEYWAYHLRDADAVQTNQPGRVNVLRPGAYNHSEPHAAIELSKLGWDAIPVLIKHMDDPRPTRCYGYWRDFSPESYFLLTYGDVCQQIFESITHHKIFDGNDYPVREGKGGECKLAAQKWYNEIIKNGGRIAWDRERNKQTPIRLDKP